MFDELWVTTLAKEEAVLRLRKRNPQIDEKAARARVYSQIDDNERVKYSSFHYDTGDRTPFEENKRLIERELERLRGQGILLRK
jgi:dephospho-CoA kinase